MSLKPKILIVEDEEAILTGLIDLFVFHGYEVDSARDGDEGLGKALSGNYDMVLLDVMLPGKDGFSICNEIRSANREQPIILLTARTSDEDIVTGLTLGADDYIPKPFSVRQLVLRVEAVLRRAHRLRQQEAELKIAGRLAIDTRNLTGTDTTRPGEQLVFTRREIEILQYLQLHNTRPIPRDELLAEVWGYTKTAQIETRTVDIHMTKLRRKVEQDPKNPSLIVTVRGEGYKLIE